MADHLGYEPYEPTGTNTENSRNDASKDRHDRRRAGRLADAQDRQVASSRVTVPSHARRLEERSEGQSRSLRRSLGLIALRKTSLISRATASSVSSSGRPCHSTSGLRVPLSARALAGRAIASRRAGNSLLVEVGGAEAGECLPCRSDRGENTWVIRVSEPLDQHGEHLGALHVAVELAEYARPQ